MSYLRIILQTCFLLCIVQSGVIAQTNHEPLIRPEVQIGRTTDKVIIDGFFDESAWSTAARVSGFTEYFPREGNKPAYDTEVRIMYDDTHLYLAITAYDDPKQIRSSLRDRDAIFNDDFVGIILDTYGNSTWAYEFFFNPIGIQGDMLLTGDDEDFGFHIVHQSKGRIIENGYVVEVAIPFRELRFPNVQEQEWRATFWRTRPRSSRERTSWAAISRTDACFLCQFGTIKGISGIKSSQPIRLLPSLTLTQSAERNQPGVTLDNEPISITPSLGLSYSPSSSLTAELTINPDFSQIESDAGQIDVNTTTALSFPERRPFFQEGSDLFDSRIRQLYTRSINSPLAALKLTGRQKKASYAFLSAWDEETPTILALEEGSRTVVRGGSFVNVARYRQSFGNDNDMGVMFTDRRYDEGGSGTTLGFDGRFRLNKTLSSFYHLVLSTTDEGTDQATITRFQDQTFANGKYTLAYDGETFTGSGLTAGLFQNGRNFRNSLTYTQFSPDFRAHTGFVTQNARRTVFNDFEIIIYPKSELVDEMNIELTTGLFYNWDGVLKDRFIMPSFEINLPGQTNVELEYLWSVERFAGVRLSGIERWEIGLSTQPNQYITGRTSLSKGKYIARFARPAFLGDGHQFNIGASIRPTSQLEISPSIAWQELNNPSTREELFSVYILRTRMSYQFTREFFIRAITEYNHSNGNFDIQPLLTYKINPFSVFYLGTNRLYSDWDGLDDLSVRSRQYFFKAQYLF
jgi:hypothetical protein